MSQTLPVAVGDLLADKYRIDRILGEGGMGVVVAAHHLELDQPVAIKFLLDNLATSEEGAERFRREARAAAKIQSDHVVRVLDVGVLPQGGARYMVMEYLDGRDLAEELQERGPLSVERAITYVLEALDAIGQAHAAGIVHRDLKPANLYLARRPDGSSRIKVLDFGISKSMSRSSSNELSLTRTSAWMGSPLYMAPEQMQSARDVDGRADLWSVGAILYELISGQPPYLAESLPQLCNLLLTTDPQPLSSVRADVPPAVNDVVMRCLSRDVSQRWQSVGELSAALVATGVVVPRGGVSFAPRPGAALAATELGATTATGSEKVAQGRTASGALGAVGAQTAAAWGRTEGTEERKRKRVWLAAGLGAAALGAVALVALRSGSGAEVATDLEAAETAAAARATPPAAAETTPKAPLEEPATGVPLPEAGEAPATGKRPAGDDTEASTKDADPPSTARPPNTTTAGTTPSPAKNPKTTPPATRPSTGSTQPPPQPANVPPAPTSGSSLSDFGGRR